MNDLNLIREFRAQLDACDELAEARARAALRTRIAEEKARVHHGRRARPVPRSRRLMLLAAAMTALAVVVGTPAFGIGPRLYDLLFQISTPAEPITPAEKEALSPESTWLLEHGGKVDWTSFKLIGKAGPLAYYEVRKATGERCFANGEIAKRPQVASLNCPAPGGSLAYPSGAQAILDFSSFALDGRTNESRLDVLTGIAADGVARVGIVGSDGKIRSTAVTGNAYYASGLYEGPVAAIVALDSEGRIVYERPLPGWKGERQR